MKIKSILIIILPVLLILFMGAKLKQDAVQSAAASERVTGNVVTLDRDEPNSYTAFAPELAATLARVPQLDPETGVYVEEAKPNLFYVTDGIYQSAFLKTEEGVIVFDAPPSFAHVLPAVIQEHAADLPIVYLVYSHGHTDHVGGTSVFADVPGLQVVAPVSVANSIAARGNPGILMPTLTYDEQYSFSLGGDRVDLKTAVFHAEDDDVIIYLPNQKFLIAVDTIVPGEVPFMNFGATADVGAYMAVFDDLLAYDFDLMLSGHLSFLGTREDVLTAQAYALDVQEAVLSRMPSFQERFGKNFEAIGYQNANLAYRMAIEEVRGACAAEIIDSWQERLSVVDVWADSHCETVIVYSFMH